MRLLNERGARTSKRDAPASPFIEANRTLSRGRFPSTARE